MKFIRKKKGSAIYSFMILVGAFLVLTWAYAVITSDEFMNRPPEEKVIGSKQARLFSIYQQGEDMLLYLDFAARYTAFQSIYDLATTGGYYGESECGRFKGYTIWKLGSVEPYCYPEMGVISEGYQKYFNRTYGAYLREMESSFTNISHYTSLSGGGEETTIRVSANRRILMVMPYSAEEKIELKLGDTGSYIYGGTYGGTTYDGLCTYCGTNKNFLKAFDSVAFSNCNTRCCRGQCPPGSTILPVPYHNQCEWGDSTYCTGACGPVSMIMALEFAAQNGAQFDPKYMDIKWVWNDLIKKGSCVPGSCGSSGFWGDIAAAAGVQGGSYGGVQWESWQKEIDNGNTVIINNHMDLDGEQRCEPVDTYHWFLLVGYSKDFAIVNDPYVPRSCPQQSGDHLVLTRGKFEKLCGYEFSNCGAYVIKGG